jgi:pullulanase-type alpha-1,6-glucosidase
LEATEAGITGGNFLELTRDPAGLPQAVKDKFPHLADLPALKIAAGDLALVPEILKGQIAVSAVSDEGLSVDATGLQIPGVLDDLYTYDGPLGIVWDGETPALKVWAPTAKSVAFHLFDDADPTTTSTTMVMDLDPATGVWTIQGDASWKGKYYLYEVEVYVHSTGQVEHNLVTDPYSLSLAMNSRRSQIVDLADVALAPAGWDSLEKPPLAAPEDISIYEIHVRDFSVNDPSVPDELKGTFKAFTLEDSNGMRHLEALADAGLTHLHLLPVFDIATINEDKSQWQTPDPDLLATYPPDSDQQQAAVTAVEDLDGFNWGYDPWHYTTPEGSYSTDPNGPARIVEFREMIQSLNEHGLRVVMDVVYNHTNASGQDEKSVLDRVVPGYYHRLDDKGQVETSTCCQNTASEHNMMEKLMIDSLVTWARQYKVDAFRFDLMGHHMVSNMLNIRTALDALTLENDGVDGKSIYLYGEGWNFGEVADNARGVNATQLNLGGAGIGTFSDRLRDAVRGGGPFDSGQDLIQRQGFANGLYYDPNALNSGSSEELDTLLLATDQIRVGMAGNLADYQFIDRNGDLVTGSQVDYNGQPAGYTEDPQEDITYISKHDNQTLYDNNAYKIPLATSMADRVRIQNVGLSTVLLGQGVPFMHAGSDLLRSKSLDRDSYNSGDWFNRLDFTYQANNFGVGLPVAGKNQDNWPIMAPLLANPDLVPAPADIGQMADLYQELLQIRYSSPLFRLQTAEEVQARVAFHNTGPAQIPGLIVMSLSDMVEPDFDPELEQIIVLINANDEDQSFTLSDLMGAYVELHPVQQNSVDPLVRTASFNQATGTFSVPGRTAAVFVEYASPQERLGLLMDDVEALVATGVLNQGQGNALTVKLQGALEQLNKDKPNVAINRLEAFINQVYSLVDEGVLSPAQGQYLAGKAESIIMQIEALY